ncbi:MAG: acyl carrier protein [Clostridiales bacterium]|jgi:acyl carrier protein|nr:acyl carrier protein [Clostridiales bacterium]NLX70567.1 acyl carrier protein [Clostridiales bacterium]
MLKFIIRTIQEFVEVNEDEITEDTHFISDLHLTSYDIVSIVGKLESSLGIEIPDDEIRNLETIGDLKKYLEEKGM